MRLGLSPLSTGVICFRCDNIAVSMAFLGVSFYDARLVVVGSD